MITPDRDDLHVISRNSNLSKDSLQRLLDSNVFNNKKSWHEFLLILFLGLGTGFLCAGIILFFAYNWDDLPGFAKMGILEFLLITTAAFSVFGKFGRIVKNSFLAAAVILVGALFAVYGQVYQTGADAYDLFFVWTVGVVVWVFVSGFPVLWLIFLVLLNTTLGLYLDQEVFNWPQSAYVFLFVALNISAALFFVSMNYFKPEQRPAPFWLINTVSLGIVVVATVGISTSIFDSRSYWLLSLILLTLTGYVGGLFYGLHTRQIFYFAIVPFSVIIIICAAMIKYSTELEMILLVFIFMAGAVTVLIRYLLQLQKKWRYEEHN